jgi:protein disulfide-isomerase-like protein
MFKYFKKRPVLQVIFVVLCLVILFAIFAPRPNGNLAGLRVNANIGNLKGGFNVETFENSTDPTLALFYAPWCGHCKKVEPIFNQLQQSYGGPAKVVSVNCDENKELAQQHGIKGFPTIRLYPTGMSNASDYNEYQGARTMDGFSSYLSQNVSGQVAAAPDQAAPV